MSSEFPRLSSRYPQKRAFITGAGSGLGLAFASALARDGWMLGLNDLNEDSLQKANELVTRLGAKTLLYPFDVSDYSAFTAAVGQFKSQTGGLDVGINNAGIGCGGLIQEVSIDVFRKVIDVNVMGVANGCHAFLSVMRPQQSGHILNVGSAAAFASPPRMSAYNCSKAAVVSLSETLRAELSDDGIMVSVLMPMYFRTNIGRHCLGSASDTRRAQFMVERAELKPDEIATQALDKLSRNELYIVLPAEARSLWRFKRLWPERFWKSMKEEVRRKVQLIDAQIAALSSKN